MNRLACIYIHIAYTVCTVRARHASSPPPQAFLEGNMENYLSNTTCLTPGLFKSGESCSKFN